MHTQTYTERKISKENIKPIAICLYEVNEHFKAKQQRMQHVRDMNETKRLKNRNLYMNEYERINKIQR